MKWHASGDEGTDRPGDVRPISAAILLASTLVVAAGCNSQRSTFTQGRLEKTCDDAIPTCDTRAGCVVTGDDYTRGTFPGGRSVIVRTHDDDKNRLIVRFLLEEMVSPGTELQLQAYSPDCGDFSERHPTDINLFERAGDDRILEFELPIEGRGDHLLTLFSDMGADYLMTATPKSR